MNSDDVLGEMCRVGKYISVELEICEHQGAVELSATLFGGTQHAGPIVSGVKIHSWGSFNLLEATRKRNEMGRHREEMERLMDDNNLRSF